MSNTAAANLVVPMAMALGPAMGAPLAIVGGLSVSFAMALPVSTPPNAMAFATGRFSSADMLRAGGCIGLLSLPALLLLHPFIKPMILALVPGQGR